MGTVKKNLLLILGFSLLTLMAHAQEAESTKFDRHIGREFPLAVQTIVNQPISTSIPGGDDFVWNLSLIYVFNREFTRK
jgi:hypothetical protein